MALTNQEAKIINLCSKGRQLSTTFFDSSSGAIVPKDSSITAAKLAGSLTPSLLTTAAKANPNTMTISACTSTALTTNATLGNSIVMPVAGNITAAYFIPSATIAAGTATDNMTVNLLSGGTAIATKVINATGTCTAFTANAMTVTTSAVAALAVLYPQYQKVGTGPAADPVAGTISITFVPS